MNTRSLIVLAALALLAYVALSIAAFTPRTCEPSRAAFYLKGTALECK